MLACVLWFRVRRHTRKTWIPLMDSAAHCSSQGTLASKFLLEFSQGALLLFESGLRFAHLHLYLGVQFRITINKLVSTAAGLAATSSSSMARSTSGRQRRLATALGDRTTWIAPSSSSGDAFFFWPNAIYSFCKAHAPEMQNLSGQLLADLVRRHLAVLELLFLSTLPRSYSSAISAQHGLMNVSP